MKFYEYESKRKSMESYHYLNKYLLISMKVIKNENFVVKQLLPDYELMCVKIVKQKNKEQRI